MNIVFSPVIISDYCNNQQSFFCCKKGALRSKRDQETVPKDVGNGLRSAKRVLPPVHVGSSMFPSVRQQQNQYWQSLLNEAARESLLQRLVSYELIYVN